MAEGKDGFVTVEMCGSVSARVLESHGRLHEKLDSIEKRLFHDNGTTSMQTRIERHEQILKVLLWALGIVVGTLLTSGVTGLILVFKWVLVHGGEA